MVYEVFKDGYEDGFVSAHNAAAALDYVLDRHTRSFNRPLEVDLVNIKTGRVFEYTVDVEFNYSIHRNNP